MSLRLTIPRSFYPPAALLGRWVRRWAQDKQQAESLTIVAIAVALTVATLASQWSWILLGEAALDNALALWVLVAHVVLGGLLAWACFWGWKPAIMVTADVDGVEIEQEMESLHLAYDDIERAERISADCYHRHWRRYAATHAFVNHLPGELLLLRTPAGPVVLGLAAADLAALDAYLAEHLGVELAEPLVRAA